MMASRIGGGAGEGDGEVVPVGAELVLFRPMYSQAEHT
jgi:hypothetical protein